MKKNLPLFVKIVFCLFMGQGKAFCQENLVPNGDFNRATTCINWGPDYPRAGWNLIYASDHTIPDTCAYEKYFISDTLGRNRSGTEGFVTYSDHPTLPEFRFVVSTQLIAPLEAGRRYYYEMYVRFFVDSVSLLREYSSYYFTDHQDVGFTQSPLNFRWSATNTLPMVSAKIKSGAIVNQDWTRIAGCFTAEGGERYVYIGNFSTDLATTVRPSGLLSQKPAVGNALYLVDDVYLTTYDLHLPADTTICASEKLVLDARFPPTVEARYVWSNGETTPQISVNQTGKYKVDIILGNTGCAFSDSVFVTAIPDPGQLNRAIDTTFCENIPLVLLAGADVPDATVVWNDGSLEKEKTVITPGDYSARISVRCGSWTETYRVQQADCKIRVFFPNAFSPNGDLLNETFFPIFDREKINIRNWNFEVFDRWGVLVFRSNDPDKLWDGRIMGHDAQEGIYVWRLLYEGQKNNGISTDEQSGTVFLMR